MKEIERKGQGSDAVWDSEKCQTSKEATVNDGPVDHQSTNVSHSASARLFSISIFDSLIQLLILADNMHATTNHHDSLPPACHKPNILLHAHGNVH